MIRVSSPRPVASPPSVRRLTPSARPHQPSTINHQPSGFTLVELLVAMGIFIILVSITIGAFRATTDDDRMAAASQQVKSSINGARSRALKDNTLRGIRFVRDPNNPTQCTALQYIGTNANDEGFIDQSLGINKSVTYYTRFDFDGDPNDAPDAATPNVTNCVVPIAFNLSTGTPLLVDETAQTWRQLVASGLLAAGTRIQLPKGTGRWYVVASVGAVNPTAPIASQIIALQLAEPYERDTGIEQTLTGPITIVGYAPTLDYSLELGAAPLADEPPVPLPKGIVLDLDASTITAAFRPSTDFNGNGNVDFAEYPNVDLMFGPNGKLVGQPAAAGMIHFYLGNLSEVDKFTQAKWDPTFTNTLGERPVLGTRTADMPGPGNLPLPEKPARIVTLLTSSGQLYSSDIDFTAPTTTGKLVFAKRGKEAGR